MGATGEITVQQMSTSHVIKKHFDRIKKKQKPFTWTRGCSPSTRFIPIPSILVLVPNLPGARRLPPGDGGGGLTSTHNQPGPELHA
jgi:hypothetical protein